MNTHALTNAILSSNTLEEIAVKSTMTLNELKATLIQLIQPIPSETASSSNFDSAADVMSKDIDSDEQFDRIVRQSPITFTEEQIQFMRLAVLDRKNLALLAGAGYGKSAIINTLTTLFHDMLNPLTYLDVVERYGQYCDVKGIMNAAKIGLCASTGKAASLIHGRTLHSYFGIGLGRGTVKEWVQRVSTARYLSKTFIALRSVQVIIIDEISMISAQLLDNLSLYLQAIRKSDLPFGDVQLIFVGDLAQLSPVNGAFMFRSREYKSANVMQFQLTKCFRQSGDLAFLKILHELRIGECSDESLAILQSRTSIDQEYSASMQPMRLVSTNEEVDAINCRELQRVIAEKEVEPKSFPIIMGNDPRKGNACRKAEGIPECVELAIGAQVVVVRNISTTIVNGTQGVVVAFHADAVALITVAGSRVVIPYISLKDPDDPDIYTAKSLLQYLPLRLGFAGTIHKSQGMSLALVDIDCRRIFCHGQMYVGISRCTSLRGLRLSNFSRKAVICDPSVRSFLDNTNAITTVSSFAGLH
jgi:ATP-dependent exoDNAse (exonuclease V) alpha subunit